MVVRAFTYSQFHGKSNAVGSTFIRIEQMIKYWNELELYMYGENPDCLIFQKVYCSEDYKFPLHFKGKKILDLCDPDWLEGYNIVESCHAVDAVTCSTETIAKFVSQFTSNVIVIPDRFDIDILPSPKQHIGKAKHVVWFGYSHNADALRPAIKLIEQLGLKLTIISNDDPIYGWGITNVKEYYTFVKYNEETIYQELQNADFAILPDGLRPQDKYKSNNRTIKANLAGLPVAKTPEEVESYMDGKERQEWFNHNYDIIAREYDVKKSVEQMKGIIDDL